MQLAIFSFFGVNQNRYIPDKVPKTAEIAFSGRTYVQHCRKDYAMQYRLLCFGITQSQ